MAIREVRIYPNLMQGQVVLSKGICTEFSFYMDAVMRGRFKEYSGSEVKGVNIVNLNLFEPGYSRRGYIPKLDGIWRRVLNTYECQAEFDFTVLKNSLEDNLYVLINEFIYYAAKSDLPQMQLLARHTRESIEAVDIKDVITRAADFKKQVGIVPK